ncbi:hypothetical protein NY406_09900 [Chlorobaculum sp. MV4-Y]|uniref:hypothetical protein n=1 Tax=Chlorobaculum sp. MV4-Y TaxID=2976335 RepID=UPI0021B03BD5|nr:hypothetical protein [Chlorobaculum sp. MV4-Y]UWX57505.1 hypothetical protein NY406_09900 [Chlorobaculum sp. MV4-Y]
MVVIVFCFIVYQNMSYCSIQSMQNFENNARHFGNLSVAVSGRNFAGFSVASSIPAYYVVHGYGFPVRIVGRIAGKLC